MIIFKMIVNIWCSRTRLSVRIPKSPYSFQLSQPPPPFMSTFLNSCVHIKFSFQISIPEVNQRDELLSTAIRTVYPKYQLLCDSFNRQRSILNLCNVFIWNKVFRSSFFVFVGCSPVAELVALWKRSSSFQVSVLVFNRRFCSSQSRSDRY